MINKKLITNILITLCYAIFTLILVFHHEIWSDEAQVWQLAKYLSISELFKHLVNEGHPSLFYLLLMPFAKTGLSIFSMQLLCWISSVIAVFLLFQFSPFKFITKLAITLSTGFIYAFPVIARSYSLIPLLTFLTAIQYKKRNDNPILYAITLFFLAHTHIIMYGFIGILTLLFGFENYKSKSFSKKNLTAFFIMCAGLFLVFLQLHGTCGNNVFIKHEQNNFLINILFVFTEFFQNSVNFFSKGIYPLLILFMFVLFICIFIKLFRFSKKAFLIAFCGIFFQLSIYIIAYSSCIYPVRIFCSYTIFLFAFWIAIENFTGQQEKEITSINILLSLFFIMSIYNSFRLCLKDYTSEYSSAKSTSEFIRTIVKPDDILMTNSPFTMNAILTYLGDDYKLIYIPYNQIIKYTVWDKKLKTRLSSEGYLKYLEKYTSEHKDELKDKNIYIIQSTSFQTQIEGAETIFKAKQAIADYETFVVLKYNYTNNNK